MKKPLTTPQKIAIAAGIIIFLLPLLFYLPRLLSQPERRTVEKRFRQGAKFVENENYSEMEDFISEDYTGDVGKDRKEALRIAETFFDNIEDLDIDILSLEVTMKENGTAEIVCQFEASGWWTGSKIYNRVPLSGNLTRPVPGEVKAIFARENETWSLIRCELEVAGVRR